MSTLLGQPNVCTWAFQLGAGEAVLRGIIFLLPVDVPPGMPMVA